MSAADFVEETTTSIASSGTGAVTLTAITSIPRFSDVWGTGRRHVRYVIEKLSGGTYTFERGLGYVESNVLTRTLPQVTWNGTTYDDTSPSALNFGTTPTTGDVKVRMAPTVADGMRTLRVQQSTIAVDANWRDYPLSGHLTEWPGNGAGSTMTVDREYYSYYENLIDGLVAGIQLDVTGATASAGIKLALYEEGADGLPGHHINTFNTLSGASTGIKTDTTVGTWSRGAAFRLAPGGYYIGFISGHAIDLRGTGTNRMMRNPIGRYNGYGICNTVYRAGSYATGLSTTTPTTPTNALDPGSTNLNFPWIGLKVTP